MVDFLKIPILLATTVMRPGQMCLHNVYIIVITQFPEKTWVFCSFHVPEHALTHPERRYQRVQPELVLASALYTWQQVEGVTQVTTTFHA